MEIEEIKSGRSCGFTGVCSRTFRRYINRYDDLGLEGILDKRLTQASCRRAPVDEVMAVAEHSRLICACLNSCLFAPMYNTPQKLDRGIR